MTLAVSEKSFTAGTSGRASALRNIIARAASCDERASARCFDMLREQDERVLSRRRAEWRRSVAGDDEHAFARILAERGITRDDVARRLADVRLCDAPGGALPEWAVWLCEADVALSRGVVDRDADAMPAFTVDAVVDPAAIVGTVVDPASEWPYHAVFEPLLQHASRWLDGVIAAANVAGDNGVSPSAARRMLAHLARRWSEQVSQLLMHRSNLVDVLAGHAGEVGVTLFDIYFRGATVADGWLALWTDYPVTARLLGTAAVQWCSCITEMLERMRADRPRLAATFAQASLGQLVDYEGGAGDPHAGGRSVAVLTFAGGTRVVYKPKDLRIAAAYMELLLRLNQSDLPLALPVRAIVCGDGYAWEEFAPLAECQDLDAVHRFYQRMGMHARLLQLLDGTDFTADNVRACGEHPVLADLETLLAPCTRTAGESSAHERALMQIARETPARSGLVSAKVIGESGRRAADVGALAPAALRVAPFRQAALQREGDGEGPATLAMSYASFKGVPATPMLRGHPVALAGFEDDVVRGYLDMSACLRKEAAFLGAADGPLAKMAELPTRYFLRSTHIYARLLEESVRPAHLRDGIARELCLERIWRARLRDDVPVPLLQSELDALRDLDIPIFAARPNGDAVLLSHGELAGVLEHCASSRALERAEELTHRSRSRDLDDIRSALFIIDGALSARPSPRVAIAPDGHETNWLAHAVAIGDAILENAARDADGAPDWIALTYHPATDVWNLGPLADDLFSGRAGLAILFAELYRLTGHARFRDVARDTAARLHCRLAGAAPPSRRCGAFTGWSGLLYAAARADHALGQRTDLPTRVFAFVEQSLGAGALDVVSGRAGLLLALIQTARLAESAKLDACVAPLARDLGERRLASGGFPSASFPADSAALRSVPAGDAGIALALRRARATLAPSDLTPRADALTAGDLLATLAAARDEPGSLASALAVTDEWLRVAKAASGSHAAHECAEVAMAAFDASVERGYYDLACDRARAVLSGWRATGTWFPESFAADRHHLSVVTGVGGLAHLFARLHAPDRVRSIRVLD